MNERNIYLFGEINTELSATIIEQLIYLDSESNEDITMYISSNGGSVMSGLAIIDTIEYIKSNVNMVVLDIAASMAAVILSCGKKRTALRNSFIMLHSVIGHMQNFDDMKKIEKEIVNIISKNTKNTIPYIKKQISFDNYMNTEEALKFKIIDEIVA